MSYYVVRYINYDRNREDGEVEIFESAKDAIDYMVDTHDKWEPHGENCNEECQIRTLSANDGQERMKGVKAFLLENLITCSTTRYPPWLTSCISESLSVFLADKCKVHETKTQ